MGRHRPVRGGRDGPRPTKDDVEGALAEEGEGLNALALILWVLLAQGERETETVEALLLCRLEGVAVFADPGDQSGVDIHAVVLLAWHG